jgi:hypothetical protein
MSDFKFACPDCGQRISASDDHVGLHTNCPACKAPLVVPANPAVPVAQFSASIPTPPGAPPAPEPQGSADYQAHVARRPKKSYAALIAGVTAVALIGLAAFFSRGWVAGKWKAFHGASAAGIAAGNQPSPGRAELTEAEIWQNVVATYKGLTSLSATGTAETTLDLGLGGGATNTAGTPAKLSSDLTMKLGRPDNFRVDVNQRIGSATMSLIGWSAGQGYYRMVNNSRIKDSSRGAALSGLGAAGTAFMATLFYNDADGLPAFAGTDWSKTKGAAIPGQPCYVLAGKIFFQDVLVWVNKQTFLIPRVQIVLGGNTNAPVMDDAKIKETLTAAKNGQAATAAEITQFKAQMKMASQIKGTITETYQDIQTNVDIALAEFEPPPSAATPAAPPPARGSRTGTGGAGAPAGGRATRIAAGARRGN